LVVGLGVPAAFKPGFLIEHSVPPSGYSLQVLAGAAGFSLLSLTQKRRNN
jgi:hypothetical protein